MRHDDQPLDLFVAGIGEREDGPIGVSLARAHVHAADDSVRSGSGRNKQPVGVAAIALGGVSEIDRLCIGAHIDRLDRAAARGAKGKHEQHRRDAGADKIQPKSSQLHPHRPSPGFLRTDAMPRQANFTSIYVDFAARGT